MFAAAEEPSVNKDEIRKMEVSIVAIGQQPLSCQQGARCDELMFVPVQAPAHGDGKERNADQREKDTDCYADPVISEKHPHPRVSELETLLL